MEIYKQGEGKIARRIAFYSALAMLVWGFKGLAIWLSKWSTFRDPLVEGFDVPFYNQPLNLGVITAVVATIATAGLMFVLLNKTKPADGLIDTETELKKVHWPSWPEARQATVIVLLFVVALAAYLTVIEIVLKRIFGVILSL